MSGADPEDSLLSAAYRVRDLVNESRPGGQPVWKHDRFDSMCAAMDAIEDADAALKEYAARPPGPIGYLELYGVFQALILQQDGIRELMDALEIEGYPADDPYLKEIRELRNDVTGHPSRRDRGPVVATQVARGAMTRDTVRIARHPRAGGATRFEDVAILPLLIGQERRLTSLLHDVVEAMESREREHRRMHRDEKLADLFPPSIHYALQKVGEAARRRDDEPGIGFGLMNLSHLGDCLDAFEAALRHRDISSDSHPFIYLSLEACQEAVASLRTRLPIDAGTAGDEDAAIVLRGLVTLLKDELDDLVEMAGELDAQYGSDEVA